MKVFAVQGSPRKDGNTATVLGWMEDELTEDGHEIDHVDIADCRVSGWSEGVDCQDVTDGPGSAIDDDANDLFERMIAADIVVLASPLYCWGFSAQLKALLDRSVCLCKNCDEDGPQYLLNGKPMALVATAAGPEEGNMDLIQETFRRLVEYQHARVAGQFMVARCMKADHLSDDKQALARAFARSLVEDTTE
ncbi:MAG: NAD(P)H-dependent oxidoreductase [bacterium]|nr:NAD(P)H-dependent oxidoreductase [bacterium]